MHYCSRAFTKGYASVPKYTPHSESFRGKLLGLSPQGSLSLLNSPHTGLYFSSLFHFFLSFFHFIHFSHLLSFLHTTRMQMNVMRLITLIHMYHQYHWNYNHTTFQNFPTIPIISILKYNYFSTTKLPKIFQKILKNSHINKLSLIPQFRNFSTILIIFNN